MIVFVKDEDEILEIPVGLGPVICEENYDLQQKTIDPSTNLQNVIPDSSYYGLSSVTVNPYVLDSKTVDSSTVSQTVISNEDGLSSVTVNPYTLDSKTVNSSTVEQVINSSADGLSSVTVNPYTVESDSSTLTSNGTYTFTPSNADALSSVTIDVSVAGSSGNDWLLQAKQGLITDLSTYTFNGVVSQNYGATHLFYENRNIISAPIITDTVIGYNGMRECFYNCTNLRGYAQFPELTTIGSDGMYYCFAYTNLSAISFPKLTTVNNSGMEKCFYGSWIISVSFPELTTIESNGMKNCFEYCIFLEEASFPKLSTINGGGFSNCFADCGGLLTVSLPEITYAQSNYLPTTNRIMRLHINPNVLDRNSDNNITSNLGQLQTLTFSKNAITNVYIKNCNALNFNSILNILQHLDLNYSNILSFTVPQTIQDDIQGSLQTAYNAAVNAGWRIYKLTITPYS